MSPLLASGIELMLVGMGSVFAFLTILVLSTMLMSKLTLEASPAVADEPDPAVLAAIAAAIARHRRSR